MRMKTRIYLLLALAGAMTLTGCVSMKEDQHKVAVG